VKRVCILALCLSLPTPAKPPAWVGRLSLCLSVCLSLYPRSNRKRLELSTPNLIHVLTHRSKGQKVKGQKVKGQGHTVTKIVTVARLLVTRAATADDGVSTHVDSTDVYSSSIQSNVMLRAQEILSARISNNIALSTNK